MMLPAHFREASCKSVIIGLPYLKEENHPPSPSESLRKVAIKALQRAVSEKSTSGNVKAALLGEENIKYFHLVVDANCLLHSPKGTYILDMTWGTRKET